MCMSALPYIPIGSNFEVVRLFSMRISNNVHVEHAIKLEDLDIPQRKFNLRFGNSFKNFCSYHSGVIA